jgi:dTDP-glucose 4,6-dehydratase
MTDVPTMVLVTGGAGFIGSHIVDRLLAREDVRVIVLDKLTYAGDLANLDQHREDDRFRFVQGDVCDMSAVEPLVEEADRVIHAAAESHVDRSIEGPREFVLSNVLGTQVMLEACRKADKRMMLISTDEVYGALEVGSFTELSPLQPNSPYSASKASADLMARAYSVTYGTLVTVVRGTNAFGPRQHPEKAIPTFISAALDRKPLPVYGDGQNRREWLFVEDWARGALTVFDRGVDGDVYNLGGGHEISNLDLARAICRGCGAPESLVTFVEDRPGHDLRYSLSWEPLESLGWKPEVSFEGGLSQTIAWFRGKLEQERKVVPLPSSVVAADAPTNGGEGKDEG